MASRVVTQLVSDLSGYEIPEGGGESIGFAYRGTSYTIDLTSNEAAEFDAAMKQYLDHGARQGKTSGASRAVRPNNSDAKAIREWADRNGIDVPARGRIPSSVREQYNAAN